MLLKHDNVVEATAQNRNSIIGTEAATESAAAAADRGETGHRVPPNFTVF